MRTKYTFFLFFVIVCVISCSSNTHRRYHSKDKKAKRSKVENLVDNTTLLDLSDNPSSEFNYASFTGKESLFIHHFGHVLLYSTKHNTPIWVGWTLTSEHSYGDVPRGKKFWADPKIPSEYRVDWYEYKESGYDRGHMCPAGDNKWDEQAMYDSFYMSNMCPQNPTLNGGPWKDLEESCRKWSQTEGSLYIVCGPVYKSSRPEKIGIEHSVDVPDGFYKVVLSLRMGNEKAIGFYYKNDDSMQSLETAATSVDNIETLTGIDFFSGINEDMEKELESQFNLDYWH